jgi:hypothetical protein
VRRLLVVGVAALAALVVGAGSAGATRECEGLRVCVPRAGPWVVVPTSASVPRPTSRWQLSCPKGYLVGGLDAELSHRALDVRFEGKLGSPVNPGVTTSQAAVLAGSYVGATVASPSFRPHIGCMPAAGSGGRVPTAFGAARAGRPTTWRVKTTRVRPGSTTVSASCARRERLVDAGYAFGFYTRQPPSASLIAGVSASLSARGNRVLTRVLGNAEISAVRAVVQVQAICAVLK